MKKSILFLGLQLFCSPQISMAQFNLIGTALIERNAPPSTLSVYDFNFENISDSTSRLNWELVSENIPQGWNAFICDASFCYSHIPLSGDISNIQSGAQTYVGLNINPDTISGEALVVFYVWGSNKNLGDTVIWKIKHNIQEPTVSEPMLLFPNPVVSSLNLKFNKEVSSNENEIQIYSSNGELILLTKKEKGNSALNIPIDNFRAGVYYIRLKSSAAVLRFLKK